MGLQDRLRDLLDTNGELSLVALGDLSSGLILDWAAREPCPREVLDLLGERAAAGFARLDGMARPETADADIWGREVIRFSEAGAEVFARDPRNGDDVLCATLVPGAALEPALSRIARLARGLAAAS
jgi:hypothetical protein